MKNILFIGGGALLLGLLVLVAFQAEHIQEARHDFVLGNGFTLVFATEGKIKEIDPNTFNQDSTDGFTIHNGWFFPARKLAVVYSLHPNAITPQDIAMLPGLFIQACHGTLDPVDFKPLSPEAREKIGIVFHELIGHGSDSYEHGKPLAMIHDLWPWPSTPDPGEENPQNPWKIVRKYWAAYASHPQLEELDYK